MTETEKQTLGPLLQPADVAAIPVVPAVLNAIFDATGHRFQTLPVTQPMLKGVLS